MTRKQKPLRPKVFPMVCYKVLTLEPLSKNTKYCECLRSC